MVGVARRRVVTLAKAMGGAAILFAATVTACGKSYDEGPSTGNDAGPTTTPNPGDRGGKCVDGKCLEGLTCVDNICVKLDVDPPNNEGGVALQDAVADAPISCDAPPKPTNAKVPCPPTPIECDEKNGFHCCAGIGVCSNQICVTELHCISSSQCAPDVKCCAGAQQQPRIGLCPGALTNVSGTECCDDPKPNDFILCDEDTTTNACPDGKVCKGTDLITPQGSIRVGVCTPSD